jgi:hypothetical protein
MEHQTNADIPDMLVYYDRYELGIAEAGKEELNSTKALNDTIMNNIMKAILNLSKHRSSTEIAIEGMIISSTLKFEVLKVVISIDNGSFCIYRIED